MTTKTERLHIAAATIIKDAGGKEFVNRPDRPAAMRRYLLRTLVRCLVQAENCRPQTARRHIRAALGLISPIGARALRTPMPVQSVTFRATKSEEMTIRPEVRAFIKTKLAEVRAKSP